MPETNTNTRLQSEEINPLKRSVDYKEIEKLVNDAMIELDRDNYETLYELYFNNTSIHQLSKKLGIARSTIRYRKNKALKQLKSIILRLKTSKRREVSHKSMERI